MPWNTPNEFYTQYGRWPTAEEVNRHEDVHRWWDQQNPAATKKNWMDTYGIKDATDLWAQNHYGIRPGVEQMPQALQEWAYDKIARGSPESVQESSLDPMGNVLQQIAAQTRGVGGDVYKSIANRQGLQYAGIQAGASDPSKPTMSYGDYLRTMLPSTLYGQGAYGPGQSATPTNVPPPNQPAPITWEEIQAKPSTSAFSTWTGLPGDAESMYKNATYNAYLNKFVGGGANSPVYDAALAKLKSLTGTYGGLQDNADPMNFAQYLERNMAGYL